MNEKYKLQQLEEDNKRLFDKIQNIERNVQISFLGLAKQNNAASKLRQSGIRDLEQTSNRHILHRDRVRARGGHSMQQSQKRNKSIEQENLRILIALARQKSTLDHNKDLKDFQKQQIIRQRLQLLPEISNYKKSD